VPEGNPSNEAAIGLIANVFSRNACDAIVDSKHPNLWTANITYDMSNGGYNVVRGLMVHSYEFTGFPTLGEGFMAVQGYVCPDLRAHNGLSTPLQIENRRCTMPLFNCYIGGEKIVSLAHAQARGYLDVTEPKAFGDPTDENVPVYTLPIPGAPDAAVWPVLALAVQVRKSGTADWHEAKLPYSGPFPAGALQYEIDPTAIAGAGIAAGDTIDVQLGQFDGEAWQWASSDGVSPNTQKLGASLGPELLPTLAAGETISGVSGTAWSVGRNGYAHEPISSAPLYETADYAPVEGRHYLLTLTVGSIADGGLRAHFSGGTTVQGDQRSGAGVFRQELLAAAGHKNIRLRPSKSTLIADGVKLSARAVSYQGDAAPDR